MYQKYVSHNLAKSQILPISKFCKKIVDKSTNEKLPSTLYKFVLGILITKQIRCWADYSVHEQGSYQMCCHAEHSIDTVNKEKCNISIIVVFHEVFLHLAL